jgi:hypothetical protein
MGERYAALTPRKDPGLFEGSDGRESAAHVAHWNARYWKVAHRRGSVSCSLRGVGN